MQTVVAASIVTYSQSQNYIIKLGVIGTRKVRQKFPLYIVLKKWLYISRSILKNNYILVVASYIISSILYIYI